VESFEPSRLTAYDKESVFAEVKRVLDEHFPTRCPSHAEFDEHSRVHSQTVRRLFGSWPEAMRVAGRTRDGSQRHQGSQPVRGQGSLP